MKNFNNRIIIIAILATVFGTLSGIVGTIITRVYLLEDIFNLPLLGDINLSGGIDNISGLVIRNAKKIVIEQNDKVDETVNNVKSGIVGIYEKIDNTVVDPKKTTTSFIPSDYYDSKGEDGQGFIVTSDGWIVSNFIPDSYKNESATGTKEAIFKKYVVVSNDKKIHQVKNIIIDPLGKYAFWQITASDLPVKRFVNQEDIKNGQLIVATNWDGEVLISSIISKTENENELIRSSDDFFAVIKIAEKSGSDSLEGFIFNLNSEIIGIINTDGQAELVSNLIPCMSCIFKTGKIAYPKFGVNYIDLSRVFNSEKNNTAKGALIFPNKSGVAVLKGGSASVAGLKEGDIITKVNNTEINSDTSLTSQINKYLSGDELTVEYIRDNKTATVNVVLK